jgi:hypothetical protein
MAKLVEERKTMVRNLVLMLAGSLALGYLSIMVIGSPIVAAQDRRPGDTPVVLVGGSLRFKAGSTTANDAWQQVVQNQDYYYPATYKVRAIVLKKSLDAGTDGPDSDDTNSHTDKTKVKISKTDSWRVDLFTRASPNTAVAHLEPQANGIHIILDAMSGALCPFGSPIVRVTYSTTRPCPADPNDPAYGVTFSQIQITVNSHPPPPPPPIICQADGATVGQCKIVFRK